MTAIAYRTVSFRVTEAEHDLLERARAKVAQESGQETNLSEYLIAILLPWAASDLGERLPQRPVTEAKPRVRSPITLAAQKLGITRDEYKQFAADLLARHELGLSAVEDVPRAAPELAPRRATLLPPRAGRYSNSSAAKQTRQVSRAR